MTPGSSTVAVGKSSGSASKPLNSISTKGTHSTHSTSTNSKITTNSISTTKSIETVECELLTTSVSSALRVEVGGGMILTTQCSQCTRRCFVICNIMKRNVSSSLHHCERVFQSCLLKVKECLLHRECDRGWAEPSAMHTCIINNT